MNHPAAVDEKVSVLIPRDLVESLRSYDNDLVYVIRRSLAHLVEEEDRQAATLATPRRIRR